MRSFDVIFSGARVLSKDEAEGKFFWQRGTVPAFAITTVAIFFALFVLLTNPTLVTQPLVLTYLIIFFGSIVILAYIGFDKALIKQSTIAGLVGGVLGFFLLILISVFFQFLSTLQLLETPPPGPITPFENWIYQLVFVAITEELFFRQTLAYIISEFFLRKFMNPWRARQVSLILIMAIAFGVIHFAAYELNFWNIFNAVVAGAILGFIRYGWPRKKDGQVVYDTVEYEGTVIQVPRLLFGGFFGCYLAHLLYNSIMLTQLMVIHF